MFDSLRGSLKKLRLSPLRRAIDQDDLEGVRAALERGADANERDKEGASALHVAARCASREIVALLLERGADVSSTTSDGSTPLHSAVTNVIRGDRATVIEMLVAAGADPNSRDVAGRTPAHYAAVSCPEPFVRALSTSGADLNSADPDGATPLHCVCGQRYNTSAARVELLLSLGADPNARRGDGATPIALAFAAAAGGAVDALLAADADPGPLQSPQVQRDAASAVRFIIEMDGSGRGLFASEWLSESLRTRLQFESLRPVVEAALKTMLRCAECGNIQERSFADLNTTPRCCRCGSAALDQMRACEGCGIPILGMTMADLPPDVRELNRLTRELRALVRGGEEPSHLCVRCELEARKASRREDSQPGGRE